MVLYVVAPRHRASGHRPTAIRTAVYAWLEEISFRTGVTALIVVAAIIIGGAIAAVDLAAYGGGRSAVRHAPAGQALPAPPQTASTAPASGPETALPRPRHDPGPPRHTAIPVAAAIPAAQTAPSNPPASPPRPDHHHQRGFPGWSRRPGGWRPEHRHGWPGGHGWPHGHGQGRARGDGTAGPTGTGRAGRGRQAGPPGDGPGRHGQGLDGRHADPHERARPGRAAGHAPGRPERHPGGTDALHHAGRHERDPHGGQAGQIASQR